MSIKAINCEHTERFQKCKNSESKVDTESSFEECVLTHQCWDDEPCPHMKALSRAEPMAQNDPKLKELRRLL
jgi:hypothetical protein